MKSCVLALALIASVKSASAQSPPGTPAGPPVGIGTPVAVVPADATNALAIIDRLYDSMRAHDTAGMRVSFHPDARFFVTSMVNGQPLVRLVPINVYLGSIAGSGERLEPILTTPLEARVNGNVATVWAPFVFRRSGAISHCGVDAFQLARTPQGWRILQLFEMQSREGC